MGGSPSLPKLLGVVTSERPKCQPQIRLTITRAVSDAASPTIPSANSSRPLPAPKLRGSPGESTAGSLRGTIGPGLATFPRRKMGRSREVPGR